MRLPAHAVSQVVKVWSAVLALCPTALIDQRHHMINHFNVRAWSWAISHAQELRVGGRNSYMGDTTISVKVVQ